MSGKKILISFMLVIICSVMLQYNNANAENDSDFVIEDGVLTSYKGSEEVVVIPNEVTIIGDRALHNNQNIRKVVIPEGVRVIGEFTFSSCKNLSEIVFPSSIEEVSISSVNGTKWLEDERNKDPMVVVNDILIDGEKAEGNVTIPNTVTRIGESTFCANNLITSVTIPNSITKIGAEAFADCQNLKTVTMADSVVEIGLTAFYHCKSLTSIRLSDNLEILDGDVFSKCSSLEKIVLPKNLQEIAWSFWNCKKLKYVTVPNKLKKMDEFSFMHCKKNLTFFAADNPFVKSCAKSMDFSIRSCVLIKQKLQCQ